VIAVLEPVFANAEHAALNAGLLRAIMLAAPREPVTFVANPQHRAAVMEILRPQQTEPARLDVDLMPPGGIRIGRIAIQHRAMRVAVRTLRPHTLVCLASTPETFFACQLLRLTAPAIRVVVVLHGNLHDATARRSRDPRHRLLDSRSSLYVGRHAPMRFVVLEAGIRDAAVSQGLLPANRTDVWPLTINDTEALPPSERLQSDKVSIGFVGAAKRIKGFGHFLEMARRARHQRPGVYQFSLIGAMQDQLTAEEMAALTATANMLSRQDYLARLRKVDYACLPLRRDTYELTASGALVDCIGSTTPLLATRTTTIEHLSESAPIGFLADTPEALADIMLDHERLRDHRMHALFQQSLAALQQERLPATVAHAVRAALSISSSEAGA